MARKSDSPMMLCCGLFRKLFRGLIVSWLLLFSGQLFAANIIISQGAGFTDSTAVSPVGGNSGTTIGQQRLKVFEKAAEMWASNLGVKIDVVVDARFEPQSCSSSQAVLGSASAVNVFADFPNAPLASTYYHSALANTLAGIDLAPGQADILARFNSSIDNNNDCLNNRNWYYGFDGRSGGNIDFLSVVLHEMGHGLGFSTFVNKYAGSRFMGKDDTYMARLYDAVQGLSWTQMSNQQRQTSMTSNGGLQWSGEVAIERARIKLNSGVAGDGKVRMYAPTTLVGGSSVSHFDTVLSPDELMEPFIGSAVQNLFLSVGLFQDIGWPLFYDVDVQLNWVDPAQSNRLLNSKISQPGKPFTLSLQMNNQGDDQATGQVVEIRLPQGLQIISAEGAGQFSNNRWQVDQLIGGASAQLNLQLIAAMPITGSVEAEIVLSTSDDLDSRPNNNQPNEDDQVALALQVMPVAPVAVNDNFTIAANQAASLALLQNDLVSAANFNLSSLEFVNQTSQAGWQLLTNGELQITPAFGFTGQLVFQYRVKAQNSSSFSNWANVTVEVVADSGVRLQPDMLQGREDQSIAINLLDNDQGLTDQAAQLVSSPENGVVTLLGNGLLTYTPDDNFNGSDQLIYSVAGINAQVSINIAPVNDQPFFAEISAQQLIVSEAWSLQLIASDVDGDWLQFSSSNLPSWMSLSAGGKLSGVPSSSGSEQITLAVNDRAGSSVSKTINLNIAPAEARGLFLSQRASQASAERNSEARFSWHLTNQSDKNLSQVTFNLTLQSDTDLIVLQDSACQKIDQLTVRCSLGNLSINQSRTIGLSITAEKNGQYQILANASATGTDMTALAPWAVRVTGLPLIEGDGQGPQQTTLTSNVVSKDLDRDGDKDLIILAKSGEANQILLNHQGGWQSVAMFDPESDSYAADVAVINGQIFIATANGAGQPNKLYLWQNDTLQLVQIFTRPEEAESRSVAFADLDGDGNQDLVFANAMINQTATDSTVYRYAPVEDSAESLAIGSEKNGEFVFWQALQTEDAQTLALADINADGWLDIVIAGYKKDWYYPNQGVQQNAFSQRSEIPNAGYTNQLAVIDVDNDNRIDDLVMARQAYGDSDASEMLDNANPIYRFHNGQFSLLKKLGQADTLGLMAKDLNNDGSFDIVFVDQQGVHGFHQIDPQVMQQITSDYRVDNMQTASLVQDQQQVLDQLFVSSSQLFNTPHAMAVTSLDYDRDGDDDLLFAATENGGSDLYLNQGNNQFSTPQNNQAAGGGGGGSLHWLGLLLLMIALKRPCKRLRE
ncbi:Ig-like domain-containing protein [Pelagibaculum spongiae]|uniref:Dystroglycan-type cadherin-like domain-containing protein n=1 Tax=Pelagibaculum spongiae TaxID=2080658 RepID=A0A2V1H206_9GAMM|nr:FG-GAP-like repeat-containing protein [Pelagibaculum spongiae]PVZ69710.1 hypothetical protein DC094_10440 [Pelagibaculum spongiae]